MKKRDIPLELSRVVEPFIVEHKKLINPNKNTVIAYELYDIHEESPFYFKIGMGAINNSTRYYSVVCMPFTLNNLDNVSFNIAAGSIKDSLNKWINFVKAYNTEPSIYDDPIIESYQKEFFEEYKIDEPDADKAPFDFNRQLILDQYLGFIATKVMEYADGTNDLQLAEIKTNAEQLKSEITIYTKNETIKKLTRIWAKMRKAGIPIIKFFLEEGAKYGFKKLLDVATQHL